jgi:hypothetical protein
MLCIRAFGVETGKGGQRVVATGSQFENLIENSVVGGDQKVQPAKFDYVRLPGMPRTSEVAPIKSDVAPPSAPTFVDSAKWPEIRTKLGSAKEIQFSTAAQNTTNGTKPDLILGADGVLRNNPDKKDPPKDGKLNIQVEGSNKDEIDAKKLADDLQKQAVKEMISYFQKYNPRAQVPQEWLDLLAKMPDLPPSTQGSQTPSVAPTTSAGSEGGSTQRVGQTSAPESQGQGERLGSSNIGSAPRGGNPEGTLYSNDRVLDNSPLPAPVPGDVNIQGPPTCTADQIQSFLEQKGSPAAKEPGFAQAVYRLGVEHGIDPAVCIGFFFEESNCGRCGRGHFNNSLGNIKGSAPDGGTDGTYRRYDSWTKGAEDWYNLIDNHYVHGRGLHTLSQVIHVYAPNGDASNNETAYARTVKQVMARLQQGNPKPVAES